MLLFRLSNAVKNFSLSQRVVRLSHLNLYKVYNVCSLKELEGVSKNEKQKMRSGGVRLDALAQTSPLSTMLGLLPTGQ